MVTISSYCLPSSVRVKSAKHLVRVCSAIINLKDAVGEIETLRTLLASPYISISIESNNVLHTLTFHTNITVRELMDSLPLHIDYSPLNISKDGK